MKHTVLALSVLSVLAFAGPAIPYAAAQVDDPTLHAGAPEDAKGVDKGVVVGTDKGTDKGKPPAPPQRPPRVPSSGPETYVALALLAGAGYWTYRRSTMTNAEIRA